RDRAALALRRVVANLPVDGKHERAIDDAARALRHEIEVAKVHDLVAPELGANGLRHPERIDVENATADPELGDVFHERHALESDALEVLGELGQAVAVSLLELDAEVAQRAGHARLLGERARCGDEHAQLATREPLERLDALTGDFHMRLGFAESLARRVEPPPPRRAAPRAG